MSRIISPIRGEDLSNLLHGFPLVTRGYPHLPLRGSFLRCDVTPSE